MDISQPDETVASTSQLQVLALIVDQGFYMFFNERYGYMFLMALRCYGSLQQLCQHC